MNFRTDFYVISDFDGTITIQDVNDQLFANFGDEESKEIEKNLQKGKIGHKEALIRHYNRLNIDEIQFKEFINKNIKIDKYFYKFNTFLTKKNIGFAITSGGFINYIKLILARENIIFNGPIYANKLVFNDGGINLEFHHELKSCPLDNSICGNCKYKIIQEYKNKFNNVIYIGDGWTDRCVSSFADILLVKKDSSLEDYCKKKNLSYLTFNSFKDIRRHVNNIIRR